MPTSLKIQSLPAAAARIACDSTPNGRQYASILSDKAICIASGLDNAKNEFMAMQSLSFIKSAASRAEIILNIIFAPEFL
jgi:hypothetical protein